jgi:hypothetical protein
LEEIMQMQPNWHTKGEFMDLRPTNKQLSHILFE